MILIEKNLEPCDLYEDDYEPEALTDFEIEMLEQEYKLSLSDEEISRIYEELVK